MVVKKDEAALVISELQNYLISPGDVFFTFKTGKVVKLLRAGSPVDPARMKRYLSSAGSLSIEKVTDPVNVARSQELWLGLRNEKDFLKVPGMRLKILQWFKKVYWDGTENGSLLDLVNIGERVFYGLPPQIESVMKSKCFDLFTRGALMGSLGATLCLALGYVEFSFLRDFYHTCMLLDMKLHEKMSFSLHEAMEKGRQDYEEGLQYLEGLGLPLETQLYQDHEQMHENISNLFSDYNVALLIARHHERVDGTGFPGRLSEGEMSDVECLLLFLDALLPMQEMNFSSNDGRGYFKKAILENNLKDKILSIRLEKMLEHIFATLPEEEKPESMSA
ncbi:MAG: hypothetical protein A2X86_19700 [Bdellovibrionales bacterium GWA2_49_15]|nr:MAG: hypothetical protein A2X86_19700 [Bdellovibrionales bacterium GWA2_49_15]HAZ13784.1 hypothetical protein [Bdellovibrionales bacterium]